MEPNQTIADPITPLIQRALVVQSRELIAELSPNKKIEAVQVLIYQVSKRFKIPSSIQLLVPKEGFEPKIQKISAIAVFLPAETILDLATDILLEPKDENS